MSLKGISERYCSLKKYYTLSSDVKFHLHLYNTFFNEYFSYYSKYHKLETERRFYLCRDLIKSEIQCNYSSILFQLSERVFHVSTDNTFVSDITCLLSPIDNILLERNLIEENIDFEENRNYFSIRNCYTSSGILSNDRICFVNSVRFSERYFYSNTYTIFSLANERYGFAANDETYNFSMRKCIIEGFSEKISFIINPPSQNIHSFIINTNEQKMFEKKQVIPDDKINSVNVLSLPDNFNIGDMFFAYVPRNKTKYEIFNMTIKPLNMVFSNIIGSGKNLYYIEGKFLFTREPIYLSMQLHINSYSDDYESEIDYYKNYVVAKRHLLVNFNGVEYTNLYGYYKELHLPVNTLIPIEIYLSTEMVNNANNTFIISWCYPYEMTTIYSSHLYII